MRGAGGEAMELEIKTAEQLVDPVLEARWVGRREARLADVLQAEDLIQLRGDRVEIAYPFSAIPTAFTVQFAGGAERYACCAIDALGMAPMLGEPAHIASPCHHCQAHLALKVGPEGVGPGSEEVMVWVGSRAEGQCRIATSL